MKKFNVAVVGATGMVGNKFLEVLTERKLPVENYYLFASKKSAGKEINFMEKKHTVIELNDANVEKLKGKLDFALFSAGGSVSAEFAPKFVKIGAVVLDNSSQWRMDDNVPLVVPEVNPEDIKKHNGIIANPNCSTIQLVMILNPLHRKYGLKRVVVSTYQSVTGTGKAAVDQLNQEIKGEDCEKVYPYQIFKNALPHCDVFADDDYTKEELKLMTEPKKILGDNSFEITATAVRVPVQGGHSESVNIEFNEDFDIEEVKQILSNTPGVIVEDDVANKKYPMPFYSEGKDEVFVGRIRRDNSQPKTLNCWIVADNLRKGAATNAVQIAEYLVRNQLV